MKLINRHGPFETQSTVQYALQDSIAEIRSDADKVRWLVELLTQVIECIAAEELDATGASSLAKVIDTQIASADSVLLQRALAEPAFLARAIPALRKAGCDDALWCIAAALDHSLLTNEVRNLVAKETLGLQLEAAHSWITSSNVQRDRITLIRYLIPELAKERDDLELLLALKHREAACLVRDGNWPSLLETFEFLKELVTDRQRSSARPLSFEGFQAPCTSRLSLLHPFHSSLQSLAFHAPRLLVDLAKFASFPEFVRAAASLRAVRPVYLVITDFGYPMGGGESFVHQTCRILSEIGFRCIWVSFSIKGLPHLQQAHARTPFFEEVRLPGGMSLDSIRSVLKTYHPDVVHTHGSACPFVAPAAAEMRIPTLFGYHFWNSLVRLAQPSFNRDIMKWISQHKAVEENLPTNPPPYMKSYVASEFVLDVYKQSGGRGKKEVYHPISDPSQYLLDEPPKGDMVVQVNIAAGKGGGILLECIRELADDIPFYVVQTERLSEDLDRLIRQEIEKRGTSRYVAYGSIKAHFKHARLVLIPSLVDETFCRVAFEAAMNGIPVLSTKSGFVPHMLGDAGVYLSADPAEWIKSIRELYPDTERLRKIGQAQRNLLKGKFGLYPLAFLRSVFSLLTSSPRRNVGLFVPWSDQGLGEQGRIYARIFRQLGLNAHVFSFQPYSARDRAIKTQQRPSDWTAPQFADTVHYSLNDREHVTLYELAQFSMIHNIGKFIQIEICWAPNWKRLRNLRMPNLKLIAVPNVETVRASEVLEHNRLDATWFTTAQCMDVLRARGVTNGRYIGHGFGLPLSVERIAKKIASTRDREHLIFCHIGGHNPVSRKQTPKVIEAFKKAALARKDIHLNVCVMGQFASDLDEEAHPQINYVFRSLSHDEILEFYREADVSIQVSSHEGLGLGFYESMSVGTPIISLNIAPHNEVLRDGVSGWFVPCQSFIPTDNDEIMVEGGMFAVDDLASLIAKLEKDGIVKSIGTSATLHTSMFSEIEFSVRIADAFRALDGPDEVLRP